MNMKTFKLDTLHLYRHPDHMHTLLPMRNMSTITRNKSTLTRIVGVCISGMSVCLIHSSWASSRPGELISAQAEYLIQYNSLTCDWLLQPNGNMCILCSLSLFTLFAWLSWLWMKTVFDITGWACVWLCVFAGMCVCVVVQTAHLIRQSILLCLLTEL